MEKEQDVVEETIVDNDVIVGNTDENAVSEIDEISNDEEIDIELTDTSEETIEETMENDVVEQPKVYTEEQYQKAIDKIIARERNKYDKKIAPLIHTLKAGGFENEDPTALVNELRNSYKEQGVDIPEYKDSLSEREQKALAKIDADEVIEFGEEAMKNRFAELYNKQDRTIRETEEMYLIGQEHSKKLARKDLLELGANPDKVLNDSKFKEFASKMASNVPVKEIYKMYQKINGTTVEKPASAGSVKNNENISSGFTQSKIDQMTPQEMAKYWDNPEFRKAVGLK